MPGYFSEVKYSTTNFDFVEIAVPTGTNISAYSMYIYKPDGSIESGPLSLGSKRPVSLHCRA